METEKPNELEILRAKVLRLLNRKMKRLERQFSEWEIQLAKALQWEEVFHQGKLLQSRFFDIKKGASTIEIEDWNQAMIPRTIPLDPNLDPKDNLKEYFKRAKKLQKGIPFLESHIKNKREEIEQHQLIIDLSSTTADLIFLNELLLSYTATKKAPTSSPKAKPLPYKEFTSSTGIMIFVGKSAKNNDILTFQIANGNDWWLHAAGVPGSHVVIRDSNPDPKTIEEAMALALEYSKAKKSKEAEIVLTQTKFVKKTPRGKPGQVQISQHKTYFYRSG